MFIQITKGILVDLPISIIGNITAYFFFFLNLQLLHLGASNLVFYQNQETSGDIATNLLVETHQKLVSYIHFCVFSPRSPYLSKLLLIISNK